MAPIWLSSSSIRATPFTASSAARRLSTLVESRAFTRIPHEAESRFILHYGDMTDSTNLIRIIQDCQPDEIYNLAAQSHVQVSFETPEYTANADAVGVLSMLEAIRILRLQTRRASIRLRHPSFTASSRKCRKRRQPLSIRARPTVSRNYMASGSS